MAFSGNVHVQMQIRELAASAAAANCRPCDTCRGFGQTGNRYSYSTGDICQACDGFGFFGIKAAEPTNARPGSLLKIAIIAKRYHLGLPLEIDGDLTTKSDSDSETEITPPGDAPDFMLPNNYSANRPRTYATAGASDDDEE